MNAVIDFGLDYGFGWCKRLFRTGIDRFFLQLISGYDIREDWVVWKQDRREVRSFRKDEMNWDYARLGWFISGDDIREDWASKGIVSKIVVIG
ncbi:hypothetical protein ACOME3_009197 [Neoechinorhynchus agilis]